jgi:high-affinity iron transporter
VGASGKSIMLQSLVVSLREGVEAALIVGIVLGYLRKTGRESWSPYVYGGVLGAAAASLAAAYFVRHLQVSEDAYEGWLMLIGSLFVASMVIWMWRTGKRMKQHIEDRLSNLPAGGARWGIFLFVFLMVFREGIETVLFLAAVSLRTTELANLLGACAGLALAIALGTAFFKGSLRVNLRKFFSVTTLVLLVVAVQLFIAGVHELSESGALPSSSREMSLVGPLVNNDVFFFVVIIALCVFLLVAQHANARARSPQELATLPAPERRKSIAAQRRNRFWKITTAGVGLASILLMSAQFVYSRVAQAVSPPERLEVLNGQLLLPVNRLADHQLHHFIVSVEGRDLRLIAILDSSDSVRVGLDACRVCGTQGYYQDGKNVICRNCAAAIYIPSIGMAGGCNPVHIDYSVDGQTVVLAQSALEGGVKVFQKQ